MENLIRRFAPPSPAGKAWVVAATKKGNPSPHKHPLTKVFDRPFFQKGRGDLGQSPESRPQARNSKNAVLICEANNLRSKYFFFCGNFAKKNGVGFVT